MREIQAGASTAKKGKPRFDFERRKLDHFGYSYAVLAGRSVIAHTKVKHHAALLAWALAVEDILTDQKTMAFVGAVTGLLGLTGKSLRGSKDRGRE